jgi:hypothetical protein
VANDLASRVAAVAAQGANGNGAQPTGTDLASRVAVVASGATGQQAAVPANLQDAYTRGQTPAQPASEEPSTLSSIGTGVAKGAAETVHTVGSFLHNHLGIPMPDEVLNPELAGGTESKNNAELAGKVGEGVGEFVLGDEGVKSLGLAKRLGLVQQVVKISAEHPIIAKAIAIGMNAMRTGAVTGGETLAKGGTPAEALEAGAAGAAGGAVLDTAVQGAGAIKALIKTAGTDIQPEAQSALQGAAKAGASEAGASTVAPQSLRESLTAPIDSVESAAKQNYQTIDAATDGKFQPNADKLKNVTNKLKSIAGTDDVKEAELEATKTRLEWQQEKLFDEAAAKGVPKDVVDTARGQFKQAQAMHDLETKVFKNPSMVAGNAAHGTAETVNVDRAITGLQKLQDNTEFGSPRLEQALGKQGAKDLLDNLYQAQRAGVKAVDAKRILTRIGKYAAIASVPLAGELVHKGVTGSW